MIHVVKIFIAGVTKLLPVLQVMLFITIATAVGKYEPQEVSATEGANYPINWTMGEYTGSVWALNGISYMPDNTDTLTLQLPESWVYILRNTTAHRSNFTFYDASDNVLGTYYLEDIANYVVQEYVPTSINAVYNPYDYYEFPFEELGLNDVGTYGDPFYFTVRIYLANNVDSWTTTGQEEFLAYVQDNTVLNMFFQQPDWRQHWFTMTSNGYDTGGGVSLGTVPDYVYSVPLNAGAVTIYYDDLDLDYRDIFDDGSNRSYIVFYEGLSESDYYYLDDYTFVEVGETPLDPPRYGVFIPFDTDYTLNSYTDYRIRIYHDKVDYRGAQEMSRGIEVQFSSYFINVQFYSNDSLYDSQVIRYDEFLERPTNPTLSNHAFVGWYIPSNDRALRSHFWDFDDLVDPEFITGDTLKLYASFQPLSITDDPSTTDPTPTTGNILTVLEGFGLEGDGGRVIVYALVIILASAFLMFKRVGGIAVVVVNLGITIIFSYLGLLPLLVLVLAYTVLIGSGVAVFTLGGASSE